MFYTQYSDKACQWTVIARLGYMDYIVQDG